MTKFTTRIVMGIIAFMAVSLTAWRSGSFFWFSVTYGITIFALLLAIVASRYDHRNRKPQWFGFVVFGWGYFLFGISPWTAWKHGPPFGHIVPTSNATLPTDSLINLLSDLRVRSLKPTIEKKNLKYVPGDGMRLNFTPQEHETYRDAYDRYLEALAYTTCTGHTIMVWFVGAFGAMFTSTIARRSHRKRIK